MSLRQAWRSRSSDGRLDARRGQVLVLFALLLPATLGMLGLGLDGAFLFAEKRAMQGAADLAALAGASKLPDLPAQAKDVARQNAASNSFTHGAGGVNVAVQTPFSGANPEIPAVEKIEVRIKRPVDTFFLPLFGIDSVDIEVRAVAFRSAGGGGEYIIFANRRDCDLQSPSNPPHALEFHGGGDTMTGRIHSNGDVRIQGGGYKLNEGVSGANTYVCDKITDGGGGPQVDFTKTGPSDFPVTYRYEDFPCTYNLTSAGFVAGVHFQHGGPLNPGVYCSNGDIVLPHWVAPSHVTFVARGKVWLTGGGMHLTPYSNGMLVYAEGSGGANNPAVQINGGGIVWSGTIYAPNGHAYLLSGNLVGKISVIADTIRFHGGGNKIEANVEGDGPSAPPRLIA